MFTNRANVEMGEQRQERLRRRRERDRLRRERETDKERDYLPLPRATSALFRPEVHVYPSCIAELERFEHRILSFMIRTSVHKMVDDIPSMSYSIV